LAWLPAGDDGETITISLPGAGNTLPGVSETRMRITPDGAVMRYLLGLLGNDAS
jgi:hypothetical protein